MMSRSTCSRSGSDRAAGESSSMPRTSPVVVATCTVGRTQSPAGSGVGEQYHAPDGYRVATGAQEAFELAGRFVDLLAGRASPVVGHFPALNRVAVFVELGEHQWSPSQWTSALRCLPSIAARPRGPSSRWSISPR